jgi:hypothetical protein
MATEELDQVANRNAGNDGAEAGKAGGIRRRVGTAYETTRKRTAELYDTAREGASRAGQRTVEEIGANPLGALAGGLAFGAILAVMLPRTRHENNALGAIGAKLNQRGREALFAARDAGRDKLDELGLNREGAQQKLADIASTARDALRSARKSR